MRPPPREQPSASTFLSGGVEATLLFSVAAALRWNGVEKFYDYAEWLDYLIAHFLAPWGYTLDGTVTWQGEELGDVGRLVVTRNDVRAVPLSVAVE